MLLSYRETKEGVYDTYISLHTEAGYSPEDTVSAAIGEYEYSLDYTKTDEACILLSFALLFYEHGVNFDFLKVKLESMLEDSVLAHYEQEMTDGFHEFFYDVEKFRRLP